MKINIITICILLLFVCPGINAGQHKGVERMKLSNGVTAVLKKDTSVPVVSVNVWVKTGSINENQNQAGLSHFIEHLMFKGSKNYTGDLMTRNVEKMGGLINAATSKEYTCYYIDIQKDGCIEAIKMLADTVSNPLFPSEEIEQERKVVVEEIQRHKDSPQSMLFEYFMETLYKNSDYKNSIIGSSDVIKNISREEIISYYKKHYVAQNMFVSVVGDFDKEAVIKTIENTFGKFESGILPQEPVIIENSDAVSDFTAKDKTVHTYLLAGFKGPDMSSDDIYVADVALNILGSGKSSRLYKILKEEKNLVFAISSSFMTLRGTGSALISAVFEPSKYDETVKAMETELDKLTEYGPSESELNKIKTNIKSSWIFGLQTFGEQAGQLGYWHSQGHPDKFENYLNSIDKVTVEDVKKFMKKYYSKEKLAKVSICPK